MIRENGVAKIEVKAGKAQADGGKVVLDGPGATAVTMTPTAAKKTSRRLAKAAREAGGDGR